MSPPLHANALYAPKPEACPMSNQIMQSAQQNMLAGSTGCSGSCSHQMHTSLNCASSVKTHGWGSANVERNPCRPMKHKKIRTVLTCHTKSCRTPVDRAVIYANLSYARARRPSPASDCPELVRWIKGSRLWCIADGTVQRLVVPLVESEELHFEDYPAHECRNLPESEVPASTRLTHSVPARSGSPQKLTHSSTPIKAAAASCCVSASIPLLWSILSTPLLDSVNCVQQADACQ
jgi:hypothetical protein